MVQILKPILHQNVGTWKSACAVGLALQTGQSTPSVAECMFMLHFGANVKLKVICDNRGKKWRVEKARFVASKKVCENWWMRKYCRDALWCTLRVQKMKMGDSDFQFHEWEIKTFLRHGISKLKQQLGFTGIGHHLWDFPPRLFLQWRTLAVFKLLQCKNSSLFKLFQIFQFWKASWKGTKLPRGLCLRCALWSFRMQNVTHLRSTLHISSLKRRATSSGGFPNAPHPKAEKTHAWHCAITAPCSSARILPRVRISSFSTYFKSAVSSGPWILRDLFQKKTSEKTTCPPKNALESLGEAHKIKRNIPPQAWWREGAVHDRTVTWHFSSRSG